MQSEKTLSLVQSSTTVHNGEQVASTSSPQPTRENAKPMEMVTNTLQNTPSLVVVRSMTRLLLASPGGTAGIESHKACHRQPFVITCGATNR